MDPPPLPDDVVAGVLRRLAPRDLATSRCVCRAWRRVVDDRRLLRADILPRSLGGIFLNLHDLWFTQFLARPTTGAAASGRLDYTVPGEPDACPSSTSATTATASSCSITAWLTPPRGSGRS
ncbi:hypothetical protein SETIT_8G061900v2 [Setaria italica]|uniref:F-box domain-containing protein n=2 Tax=Setaria TaxID=4554 RepID=A0A368S4S6_SETIT|nr:hypothetical protein SETIT_8G061900v2 [Setaria italica]TKV99743.1 hypothetical protein SEVIR_8G063464v2 [Setaria viridis]